MKEEDTQKGYEKMMAKNDEIEFVHVASLASKRKWICQDHFVNSTSRNEGGYPTGEAPTPRVDPDTLIFRDPIQNGIKAGLTEQIWGSRGKSGKSDETEDLMLSKSKIQTDTTTTRMASRGSYLGPSEHDHSRHCYSDGPDVCRHCYSDGPDDSRYTYSDGPRQGMVSGVD